MSNHHSHHRSSRRSRARMHHSSHYQSSSNRSRTSSTNLNTNGGINSSRHSRSQANSENKDSTTGVWSEHRSSSGKVYYYNPITGVSQWEIPPSRQPRLASPVSEISESSSIRQQQDNSPSSSASLQNSAHSETLPEDKPLLTPSLEQYFKKELIVNFNSSHVEELEEQANLYAREAILLNERILKESVDLKIARSVVHYVDISIEAHEKKYSLIRDTISNFGFA